LADFVRFAERKPNDLNASPAPPLAVIGMVKGFIATVLVVFAASLMLAGCLGPTPQPPVPPGTVVPTQESGSLKSFSSWDEVSEFVRSSHSGGYFGGNYMARQWTA